MKEIDYVNATDLVKVRIARNVVQTTSPVIPDKRRIEIIKMLDEWEEELNKYFDEME